VTTDLDVFDLGGGRSLRKGTPVVARNIGGERVRGTLSDVEYKDGQPTVARIWTVYGFRFVPVNTVKEKRK